MDDLHVVNRQERFDKWNMLDKLMLFALLVHDRSLPPVALRTGIALANHFNSSTPRSVRYAISAIAAWISASTVKPSDGGKG